jgi:ribosome-associated protein
MIIINNELAIPEDELMFAVSRSGGPGGQNVNKVSSRVTLAFDVKNSPSLSENQRQRICDKLTTRINNQGVLRVISQRTRSQELNREDAVTRFSELLRQALHVERPRVKAGVPAAAHRRRLEEKKARTEIKRSRTKRGGEEE